jgi:1-deoxy-D-xylulose-5-phosphate reductoisomerase
MVQFRDSSVKAQLSVPDMRLPIQYAFTYPNRIFSDFKRLDFNTFANLTFEKPDTCTFRHLALAYEAIAKGGNMPCILNAANEVAVAAFLEGKTGFLAMSDIIEKTMKQVSFVASPNLDDYMQTDAEARAIALAMT